MVIHASSWGGRRFRTALLPLVCLLSPRAAFAHGSDANQVLIRLAADTANVVATPSSGAFAPFDDDGDGRLDVREVAAHRAQILAHFEERFGVTDQDAVPGVATFEDVSTPHAKDALGEAGVDHLRVTLRYRWVAPPRALRVQWQQAREHPLAVTAMRVSASPLIHEQEMLGPPESVMLDGFRPGHAFLGALTPEPAMRPPWAVVLAASFLVGVGVVSWLRHRRSRRREAMR